MTSLNLTDNFDNLYLVGFAYRVWQISVGLGREREYTIQLLGTLEKCSRKPAKKQGCLESLNIAYLGTIILPKGSLFMVSGMSMMTLIFPEKPFRTRGQQTTGPWAKSSLPPVIVGKFHWNITILIHLHSCYGCFHAIMMKLSSCNKSGP